jgi:hypothetical protein
MPKVKIIADKLRWEQAKWHEIREITEAVLKDFQRLGAQQVNVRLNESGTHEKRPVFIDWLAVPKVLSRLSDRSPERDLGKYRLGEGTPSQVYNEGLDQIGKKLIERKWNLDLLLREKRVESKLLVQKAGLMYQKFVGIIANEKGIARRAGLLTVSFEKKPANLKEIDRKMMEWASWPRQPKSPLVEYIEQHFVIGGPSL